MNRLLVPFFYPKTKERLREFETCIKTNIDNDFFSHITVFAELKENQEIPEFLSSDKIKIIKTNDRSKYSDFFSYAKENFEGGDVVVIANTDIYFDNTIHLVNKINLRSSLLCLTRKNVYFDGSCHFQGDGGSHDAWIFKNPLNFSDGDLYLGILGCDSLLAHRALKSGIRVTNPCLSINVFHLHRSSERYNYLNDGTCYWNVPGYNAGIKIPFTDIK